MSPTNLISFVKLLSICSDPRLQRGFSDILSALIKTKSCLLSEWARSSLCFDAFIKKICRFFRNKNCSWELEPHILDFFLPRFQNKKWIPILIDPSFVLNRYMGRFTKTSSDQKEAKKGFFLFSASLPVKGRAISFFQACYRYTQIDWGAHKSLNSLLGIYLLKISSLLKKMAITSKAVLIMDRGFGYEYFLAKLKDFQNHYVLRVRDTKTHVILVSSGKKYSIDELIAKATPYQPVLLKIKYKSTLQTNLVICKKSFHNKLMTWALLTDLDDPDEVVKLYKQRMKIEETFKDWKSTGFDIEKLQIRQWDVLPKLIWCVVLAHLILYLIGEKIHGSKQYKKYFKRFIQNKKNLSHVQLAWKAWLYDHDSLNDLLNLLISTLSTERNS